MPSAITHAYFGLDMYDSLDHKSKDRLKDYKEYLKTFSQGPDILYFDCFPWLCKGADIRDLASYVHKHKTRAFFINLITYIKEHNLQNKPDVIAYLYGAISHYALDSTTHPFIFYKTGIYDKKRKKETGKYFGLHHDMETYIDAYMIYVREKTQPKDFKAYNFCFNATNFSDDLVNTIDYAYKETYAKEGIGSKYLDDIKRMKNFFYLIKHDRLGIKLFFYRIIDHLIPYFYIKKEALSYHVDTRIKMHYLNLEKKEWNHPTDINEKYNYSFIELYSIALKKAIKIIQEVNAVLYDNQTLKSLEHVFLNLSYTTGKDIDLNLRQKYFEF